MKQKKKKILQLMSVKKPTKMLFQLLEGKIIETGHEL